jgi:hypothetical protein
MRAQRRPVAALWPELDESAGLRMAMMAPKPDESAGLQMPLVGRRSEPTLLASRVARLPVGAVQMQVD